jgi:putative MFS transporter
MAGTESAASSIEPRRFTAYQKQLFVFLSVACFFEGYDFFALSQLLPNLRAYFALNETQGGLMVSVVNAGTVLAYVLVRQADRWGRRRTLTLTILGYTLFSLLSGLAWNAVLFTAFQFIARVFLIGEWATSMVIAAEEYPAERRGLVIGVISAAAGLGSIVCAGVVPLLLKTSLGWRAVYLVGVVPLLLVAYARRSLRETERFRTRNAAPADLFAIWRTPSRRRVLELGSIWFLCYICSQTGVTFWKEFALKERGLSDAAVGGVITVAALVAMPIAFSAGYLLDRVGRRVGGTIILLLLSLGVFLGYTVSGKGAFMVVLCAATVGTNAMLTVLNTFNTELFPTEQRGSAFAWANNLLGRIGYCIAPVVVAALAQRHGWGPVVRLTAIFPLAGCALIWLLLPETRGRELEDIARPST